MSVSSAKSINKSTLVHDWLHNPCSKDPTKTNKVYYQCTQGTNHASFNTFYGFNDRLRIKMCVADDIICIHAEFFKHSFSWKPHAFCMQMLLLSQFSEFMDAAMDFFDQAQDKAAVSPYHEFVF